MVGGIRTLEGTAERSECFLCEDNTHINTGGVGVENLVKELMPDLHDSSVLKTCAAF